MLVWLAGTAVRGKGSGRSEKEASHNSHTEKTTSLVSWTEVRSKSGNVAETGKFLHLFVVNVMTPFRKEILVLSLFLFKINTFGKLLKCRPDYTQLIWIN